MGTPACISHHVARQSAAGHESRDTNHESWPLWPFGSPWVRQGRTTKNRRPDRLARRQVTASLRAFARQSCCPVTASLFTSVCSLLFGYCSALFGIIRGVGGGWASVGAPSAVLGGPHDERREPQLPSPSGLLALRLAQDEPMLRKGNVLLCANRGTFYIALTAAGFDFSLAALPILVCFTHWFHWT